MKISWVYAGLVYRYYASFPSWIGGFDSRILLFCEAFKILESLFY